MISKAINKETGVAHANLINLKALNANQWSTLSALKAYFETASASLTEDDVKARYAALRFKQSELIEANGTLFAKKYAPYYIIKNVACKRNGLYDLNVFKLSSDAAKAIAAKDSDVPAKKKSKKKKAAKKVETPADGGAEPQSAPKKKRESRARKEKIVIEEPTPATLETIEPPM